ncbi:MAG: RluA family pseudouridine synthase [Puniceicoccales bacterium]|jgi:23S rRNA pseudouridine1911/1915/1917 synthase|nr:RluA family pseudouridine synthase [Puniceicoccales bacterium]
MVEDELEIVVREEDIGKRVDQFLRDQLSGISRTRIRRCCDAGLVVCGGISVAAKHTLRPGELIKFRLDGERNGTLSPIKMPLHIVFEDDDMIAVNKPAGVVVHPGNGTTAPTLLEGILSHCALSRIGSPLRGGVVHRIDKWTSGLVLFAKTDAFHLQLVKMFSLRRMKKTYDAIACGTFERDFGEINAPIGRNRVFRTKMAVSHGGKEAITRWVAVERFGNLFAHLRVSILTGRTHQIRVHMANIGHPIAGDVTYGYNWNYSPTIAPKRVMLHASSLAFEHPFSKSEITLAAPLADDFSGMLRALSENFRR